MRILTARPVIAVYLILLFLYVVLGVPSVTFHGDEAMQIYMSSDYATAILDGMGLRAKFFDLGYEMAATILEFLGEGHEADDTLFARLPFLQAEDIPVLREVVPRTHIGGVDDASREDQLVLLRMSMYYSEPVIRMGRLTPELMAQIVEARGQLAQKMPADLKPLITLYDAATYTDGSLTLSKDFNGLVPSIELVATDAYKAFYVPGPAGNSTKFLGRSAVVLGVKYSF